LSHNESIDRDLVRSTIKDNTLLTKQVRELESEVDRLNKLTPQNPKLRNPEGTELRNQEMKNASELVDKNKEIESVKLEMKLKADSNTRLSAKADEDDKELNRRVDEYKVLMQEEIKKTRLIDSLKIELKNAGNKEQIITTLKAQLEEAKSKDKISNIMKLQSIETERIKPELTKPVKVLETDAVRSQEESTSLKKKIDTRTILVQYLLDTQDRYAKRLNAVDIDIKEVRKLAE
jgi:hypothetical protein